MRRILLYLLLFTLIFQFACSSKQNKRQIIVFHAGSLSLPFRQMKQAYEKEHPDVEILLEAAGSVDCARKITDLNKDCDIMASADYTIIDEFLIPKHSLWNIRFAANEMALVYSQNSAYASEINTKNWYSILMRDDVIYARSNPNSDPCGYRTLLCLQLADKYYDQQNIFTLLKEKDNKYIRPKEVDLIALLETNTVDYIFLYRSVAEQHGLPYLVLPDSINLRDPSLDQYYNNVSIPILGDAPDKYITKKAQAMVYGITLLTNAPNKEDAMDFIRFILSKNKGGKIMQQNGQSFLVPDISSSYDNIPDELKQFAKPLK